MIAGFERRRRGQVVLDGLDVANVPPHKRNMVTVFQNCALFHAHTDVEKNVAFGLKYTDTSKEDGRRMVGRALELVRLSGYEKRRPNQALRRAAAARGPRPR